MSNLGPACPKCGNNVPYRKTQWGLGKPFACESCKASLLFEKQYWPGLAALALFWLIKPAGATLPVFMIYALPFLIAIALYGFLMKPKIVD